MRLFLLCLAFACLASAYEEEDEYADLNLEDLEYPDTPFARAAAAISSTDKIKEKDVIIKEKERYPPLPPGLFPGHFPPPPPGYKGPLPPYPPFDFDEDDYEVEDEDDHDLADDAAPPRRPGGRPPYPFPPYGPPPPPCPNRCNVDLYKKCTCKNPAMYTDDGRGNCNVGASKLDLRVWCYVDDTEGKPHRLCPDALPSKSKPGHFWSRIACITG